MPTETDARSLPELQADVNRVSRQLEAKQEQLRDHYAAMKNREGQWQVDPNAARHAEQLEAEAAALTAQKNGLMYTFAEARNAANLERGRSQPGSPFVPWSQGTRSEAGESADLGNLAYMGAPNNLTDAFTASKSYKEWLHGAQGQTAAVELPFCGIKGFYATKATLTTATGPFTSIDKQPQTILLGQQQLTVADLFSQGQTSGPTVRYIQEDSFTNAAGMVAEEGQKPEFTWDLSEVDATVRKIAGVTKVSDESIKDWPQLRTYIDERLPFAIRQREEFQLLNGDGTGQNLLGVMNVPGILTQALVGNNIDTLYLAITKVRTQGFFEPDAIVIHPDNWSAIRLLKTTQGEYEYGHPAVAGPETIFGKRVVITANATLGTAVVGAWKVGGTVFYREGLRIEMTNSDQNDFIYNRIALRAEQRETVAYWRPKAFAKCTGLTVPS